MNVQDIVYPLGEFLQWTFGIVELLDNLPNTLLTIGGFVGIGLWLVLQRKYDAKAVKENALR